MADGEASLTFSDAVAVRRGLLATRDLSRTLSQDDLSWLSGQFSVEEHAHVATALARLAARSALQPGPTMRAFAALEGHKQAALRKELEQLWTEHNRATDGSEYLQILVEAPSPGASW
ncbi:MAG: hypothetical protein AMXMBFR33_58620 [Candidatus Xenobia bacterium]